MSDGFVESFELVRLKSGSISLRSLENRETYHPGIGPAVEARILHVEQQNLERRVLTENPLIVWDVGLGAGANALAVVGALTGLNRRVELHSFDQSTAPLEFALQNAACLEYLAGYEPILSALLTNGSIALSSAFSWRFHRGDFGASLRRMDLPAPHSILYDPYSPSSNPGMWSLGHFTDLFKNLDPNRACLLTNYTRSTAVRVTLLLAGFFVGIGKAIGEKAETTVASNQLGMLESPLDRSWLDRVKASRNSAPLGTGTDFGVAAISPHDFLRLQALPQFQ